MKKYIIASVAAATLMTISLLAADIDGKWTMEREGKNGKQTTTLTLKSDGGKLTGTMEGGGGRAGAMPLEITDGKIEGAAVSFKVMRAGRGGGEPTAQEYKGTLSATELKLTTTGGGGGGFGGGKGKGGGAPGGPGGDPAAAKGGPGGGGGPQELVFTKAK